MGRHARCAAVAGRLAAALLFACGSSAESEDGEPPGDPVAWVTEGATAPVPDDVVDPPDDAAVPPDAAVPLDEVWAFDEIGIRRIGWAEVTGTEAVLVVDTTDGSAARVVVRRSGDPDWSGAVSAADDVLATHHELRLRNLAPSTSYLYAVSIDGEWAMLDRLGRPLSLRTAPEEGKPSCVGLLADSQGFAFDELLPSLAEQTPAFDSMLFLGDLVAVGADPAATADQQYLDYLLGPLSDLTAHVPLFAAFGNHDASHTNDPIAYMAAVGAFRQHLALPERGLTAELDYSFEWGDLAVVVVDSVDATRPKSRGTLTTDQLDWIRDELLQSGRSFRIVALHHLVHGWEAPAGQEQAEWFHVDDFEQAHAVFVDAGVDLVLSGHRHAFNRVVVDGVTYLTLPPLARDAVIFDLHGEANFENLTGDTGSLPHAFGTVFGYGVLCVEDDGLHVETHAYDAEAADLRVVDVPETVVR